MLEGTDDLPSGVPFAVKPHDFCVSFCVLLWFAVPLELSVEIVPVLYEPSETLKRLLYLLLELRGEEPQELLLLRVVFVMRDEKPE